MILRKPALLSISIILFSLITLVSCENQGEVKKKNPLVGVWNGQSKENKHIQLTFDEDNTFYIQINQMGWDGTYDIIDKNTVRIVDKYCGTKLPGMYKFSIKKEQIEFEVITDEYCQRRIFFPVGEWVLLDQNPSESAEKIARQMNVGPALKSIAEKKETSQAQEPQSTN